MTDVFITLLTFAVIGVVSYGIIKIVPKVMLASLANILF